MIYDPHVIKDVPPHFRYAVIGEYF